MEGGVVVVHALVAAACWLLVAGDIFLSASKFCLEEGERKVGDVCCEVCGKQVVAVVAGLELTYQIGMRLLTFYIGEYSVQGAGLNRASPNIF